MISLGELVMVSFALTDKVHKKLKGTANKLGVEIEALGNTILMLSLCDENALKQAVNLIKAWQIGGQVSMENRQL